MTILVLGFYPFAGDGFALLIPSKWGPSQQQEFPGSQARFEDNFDAVNNLSVSVLPSDKKSVKDYGSPAEFLSTFQYLLGSQSYEGSTKSEVCILEVSSSLIELHLSYLCEDDVKKS